MQPGVTDDLYEVPQSPDDDGGSSAASIRRNCQSERRDHDDTHKSVYAIPEVATVPADLLAAIEAGDIAAADPPAPRAAVRRKPTKKATQKRAARRQAQIEDISDEDLLAEAGVSPIYSTTEAAQFFDMTPQWIYWGLGRDKGSQPVFVHPDGTPIEPERIGNPQTGRRRFDLPIIKAILLASYRRGNVEQDELKRILRRIRINELGGEWREREGWHRIRGKWVHPDRCERVRGEWVKKATEEEDVD